MKKLGVALAVLLVVGMLAVLTTTVYAQTTIDGFVEVMRAGLDGLEAYFKFLLDAFEMVL